MGSEMCIRDRVEDVPENMTSVERDERIIEIALDHNAIVITGDNAMKAHAIAKNIFTIFI